MADHPVPIRLELGSVFLNPFSHEPKRSPRQITGDDLSISDRDLRHVTSVAGVEVGGG